MESPTESQTTFTAREPISLITKVLSDEDDFGIVRDLPGDDAQISIDMIDEVSPHEISRSKVKSIDLDSNLHILSTRR
jgi:hypothetical protein